MDWRVSRRDEAGLGDDPCDIGGDQSVHVMTSCGYDLRGNWTLQFAQPWRGSEKSRTQIQAVSEREHEHQNSGSAEKQKMLEHIGSGDRTNRAGHRARDCSHVSLTMLPSIDD